MFFFHNKMKRSRTLGWQVAEISPALVNISPAVTVEIADGWDVEGNTCMCGVVLPRQRRLYTRQTLPWGIRRYPAGLW